MPRGPRLDAPGLVHHIRARGIEGRKIFIDDRDRDDFVRRLADACSDKQAFLYAWSLMPNHFHLTLRTGATPLSTIMRRLMTGFATYFNRRHKRQGHLFQNRFWSTVVDADAYLLALVRYIHLNPLVSKLVGSIKSLAKYPWTGHSALMGTIARQWQDTDEILGRFARQAGTARRKLVTFMSDHQTARKEVVLFKGGGLIRSAGGVEQLQRLPKSERAMHDERVLGGGQFVESILEMADQYTPLRKYTDSQRQQKFGMIQSRVCQRLKLETQAIETGCRRREIICARRILVYLAVQYLGLTGKHLSERLNVSQATITRDVVAGKMEMSKIGLNVEEMFE
jgi:REP-associated tyrosine transposase